VGSGKSGALKIGEVAARSGLTVKTIRFYCDEGLIHPIGRTEGRYRLFDDSIDQELALIRTLKAMELPLTDILKYLESKRTGTCTCDSLKETIAGKVHGIQKKIQDLENLSSELTRVLLSWEDCGGTKQPESSTKLM
jgi:DNA-binding transcriptional MerR regulator